MTQQDINKTIVTDFRNELTNKRNLNAWETFCKDDFKHHFNLPDVPSNIEGIKILSGGILSAFPDLKATVDLLFTEGNYVIERVTLNATHNGNYRGIAPSGKHFEWNETNIFRLSDNKIVELFAEVRLEKLLWQIGGKGEGFVAPTKSVLSSFIAFMMTGISKLYKNRNEKNLPKVDLNKSIINKYVQEFKNQQKFSVFPKLFSSKFTHHFNFPTMNNKMDSFVSVGQNFLSAFPDVKVELQRMFAEEDLVVEQNKVSATHKGTFNGIKATNKKVYWTETHIYRLKNGKIIENFPAVNFERILIQIM